MISKINLIHNRVVEWVFRKGKKEREKEGGSR